MQIQIAVNKSGSQFEIARCNDGNMNGPMQAQIRNRSSLKKTAGSDSLFCSMFILLSVYLTACAVFFM